MNEQPRRPGVVYAMTDEGLELPVIDVTHPAFALQIDEAGLSALIDGFVRETRRQQKWPRLFRRLFLQLVLSRSILGRGLTAASGSFLSGMNTYLMKLGPDHLGSFATPIDRKLAASLPVLGMRLRLEDIANLLAAGLGPRLDEQAAAPLHLVNIGGGTAIDSLNALLVLRRDSPDRLRSRSIRIQVFDLDEAGPRFGARALESLQADGAALNALDIQLERVPYDWSRAPDQLGAAFIERIPYDAIAGISSEGALFEYGSDQEIVSNLQAARAHTPSSAIFAGSVTRADGPAAHLDWPGDIPLHPRSIDQFDELARRAGWMISEVIERPFSRNLGLRKIQEGVPRDHGVSRSQSEATAI